ncbi:MAG: glycosyltransferase family 4 protein [Trichocoleus desertorum ATA4-8-CV12]|jgi:glycosyltransferase involved in cell wall biosynthesis|nr:glycosyltransferase family 4 protein [Trichocoleus desertorum ATA4-8-CV12]
MKWPDNSLVIYSNLPIRMESWAPPSVKTGVGGSEEAVIYLGQELAKLGYQVTVFNSCGDMEGEHNGVLYQAVEKFNPHDHFNVLIFHRSWLQPMTMKVKANKTAIWLHDNPQILTQVGEQERSKFLASFDKLLVLSRFHKSLLPDWIPEDKVLITRNGINLSDFNVSGIARNPKRLIYISDYLRGIEHLLARWSDVLKEVPDAELHLFYGWETYDAIAQSPLIERFPQLKGRKEQILILLQQKNVYEHGRIGHIQLIKELCKSGIYVYPCHFPEVFCIAGLKAQACGCIPVVTNYAALAETIQTGIKIDGCAGTSVVDKAFVEAVIDLLKNPEKQELMREKVKAMKTSWGWNKVAQQWHDELL